MAWFFDANQQVTTSGEIFFKLKETLKAAGWTVVSSSDGTTLNASGDQITQAGSGAGGMYNVRAWFRIRSPSFAAKTREFIFQPVTAVASAWRIKYSVDGFSTIGSQTATVTPSGADEVILLGGGTDASPTGGTANWADGGAGTRLNVICGNAAEGYAWYLLGWLPNLTSATTTVFGFDYLLNTDAADVDPYALLVAPNSAFLWHITQSNSVFGTYSTQQRAWILKGLAGAGFVAVGGVAFALTNTIGPSFFGTDPTVGGDGQLPIIYQRYSGLSAPIGFKGVSKALKHTTVASRRTGIALSQLATADRVLVDLVSFPWNGSDPLI